jgi:hypothetical protein
MRSVTGVWPMLPLVLAGLAVSCQNDATSSPTPAADAISTQMADAEMESDSALEPGLDQQIDGATTSADVSFTRTYDCPAGGRIVWQGSVHRTYDAATLTGEAWYDGTRTTTDCAHTRGSLTTVVNGSAEWDAFRRRVNGRPDGLQTTHHAGSWDAARSDGATKSCSFDVTIVRDPAAMTRTLDATLCGRTIHRVTSWQPGS